MSHIVGEYHRVFQARKMSSDTLRLFSLAEKCHTQNYLSCFKLDFYTVKSKFGVLIE